MVKFDQANQVIDNVNLVARAARNVALLEDAAEMAKERTRIDKARAENGALLAQLRESTRSDEGKALLADIDNARVP